jgi:plasmid stabilization system protein ParE
MSGCTFGPHAGDDLLDLWENIAAENREAADRLIDLLYQHFDRLAASPRMGHSRPDLLPDRPSILFWPAGTYLIIYRADCQPIEIVAVTHRARDISTFLRGRLA